MTLALALFAIASVGSPPNSPDGVERRRVFPLDFVGVRLDDGLLKTKLEEVERFYLRIPNDDLLLGFRRRAGLPAPGKELGGWYSSDTFHIFGQILSGLARLYAATGDAACKDKAETLMREWAKCIRPDGYFYYSNSPNAPHYIYDKMVGGLVDIGLYLHDPVAFKWLAKISEWAESNLERSRKYRDGSTEWYTLSENLYRAYLATHDTRYFDFAKVWEYTAYWSIYDRTDNLFDPNLTGDRADSYHAYSHVNTLGGAALAFRLTGDAKYLKTISTSYRFLQDSETFATGGYGPNESIVPPNKLEGLLDSTDATFETQCGSWAAFKLSKNLIAISDNAEIGDWVEKLVYNGIAASPPSSPTGNVFYYSDYNPFGAEKFLHSEGWTCCAGTQPMAVADIADLIYFRSEHGLSVNLFVPSTATVDIGSAHVVVRQSTRFPEEPTDRFSFVLSKPTNFALRLRKPAWLSAEPRATLNGEVVRLIDRGNAWIGLKRTWRSGDRLNVTLPMALHTVPLFKGKTYPTALAYGPIVLAFRTNGRSPANQIDPTKLDKQLVPSPGEPLTFHLRSNPNVLVRPFYDFALGERYFMYLDPIAPMRVLFRDMKRSEGWHVGGNLYTNIPGSWVEGRFEGTGVRVIGEAFDDAGFADVDIDGKRVGEFDQYGAGRGLDWSAEFHGFAPGTHTIRISVAGRKVAASKDVYVNVDGVQGIR